VLYERGLDLYAVELHRDGELVERVDEVFFDTLGETLERLIDDGSWRRIRVQRLSVARLSGTDLPAASRPRGGKPLFLPLEITSMTVRFKGTELRPVLAEAVANQCRVILVKDQGVYFLAERGERRPDGRQKTIAYAVAATRMSMRSTTGGNWRAPSSAATTSASSSIRRRACLRASCTARTTSTCPPPRHTCRCRRFLPRPAVTDRPSLAPAPGPLLPGNADSRECRLPLACAPSWRHASAMFR
jgi:hypothetical protein